MGKKISGFHDLEVYRNTYGATMRVFKEIIPKLPVEEKYDLTDQIRRACKAVPRLIAEGYAKKHQRMGFQKYIDDAMAECNEMVVSLSQCKDLYRIACEELIDIYDKSARQLYKLSIAWTKFKNKERRSTQPKHDTSSITETDERSPDTGGDNEIRTPIPLLLSPFFNRISKVSKILP